MMRVWIWCCAAACLPMGLYGQMTIMGARLVANGSPSLVVNNLDIRHYGQLDAGRSKLVLQGSPGQLTVLEANDLTIAYDMVIGGAGSRVVLEQDVDLLGQLQLNGGQLDLQSQVLTFSSPGQGLSGENNESYVTAGPGGFLWASDYLELPAMAQPGGFGLYLSAPLTVGLTEIRRGHEVLLTPGGPSIGRWYEIKPEWNDELDADLVLSYLAHELQGADASSLVVWRSLDGGWSWEMPAQQSIDAGAQLAEVKGEKMLGLYTLAPAPAGRPGPLAELAQAAPALAGQLQAYPNPVSDELTVSAAGVSVAGASGGSLTFDCVDSQGRSVFRSQLDIVDGQGRKTISLGRLPAGIYWLKTRQPGIPAVRIIKS